MPHTSPKLAFTFPGQGSYDYTILQELYHSYPQTQPYFVQAQDIAQRFLEADFLPLILATSAEEHDERLAACPDLDQIGIYLTEVLIAKLLLQHGMQPELLVGHSFGELAALATADVFTLETGLKIVCQRVLALQALGTSGKMAAVSCGPERMADILAGFGHHAIDISVINHPRQTVVSGDAEELDALRNVMASQGIALTLLRSRYPYHSSLLAEAVKPFKTNLQSYDFHHASIPVYLFTERAVYAPGCDLATILSSHFVRRLNFNETAHVLYENGYRHFIECGAGNLVSNIIVNNLKDQADIITQPAALPEEGIQRGIEKVFKLGNEHGFVCAVPETTPASHLAPHDIAALVGNISTLSQTMARLLEQTSTLLQQVSAASPGVPSQEAAAVGQPAALHLNAAPVAVDNDVTGDTSVSQLAAPQEPVRTFVPETCEEMPIAIVSMGCVLPGAKDAETFWQNTKQGISGILNLAEIDPGMRQDFMAGSVSGDIDIVPDKTYALLNGTILDIAYDQRLLSSAYCEDEFNQLTRGQKLLLLAAAQSLASLTSDLATTPAANIQCILGATADGSSEYDEALLLESLYAATGKLDEPEPLRREFAQVLEEILGYRYGDAASLAQDRIYQDVIQKLLARTIPVYVIDTACSSSLYAINMGIKALRTNAADVIFAGGVFAPGPANNTLFAQFRGLTPSESRPFDAAADGVVFSDGAGIAVLKRLPDALADGDHIIAVIRGMGLSSDGKSPSINVPQAEGQSLAMRRAYQTSHIDINSIQYIEAHATATPVGDAVEYHALQKAFDGRQRQSPITLGSVKALIGHTGWVSGVAAVIKICKAFEDRVIPRQYNYQAPNPEIDFQDAPFTIAQTSHAWPENIDSYPRRAGINSFGFGGTNAHLILEDYDDAYHRHLCQQLTVEPIPAEPLAVVGVTSLFPTAEALACAAPSSQLRFHREALRLPAKKRLLPDVTDHMDASQYLAALAGEEIFSALPDGWMACQDDIGVVVGMESKTERGVLANERIFLDRLRRLYSEHQHTSPLSGDDGQRMLNRLIGLIREQNIPSGPYTLPGLMPNVAASRLTSLFDLKGPNVLIDLGRNSLFQSLFTAGQLLIHQDCKMVLAGGINAFSGHDGTDPEFAVFLALTTLETAREEGLPIVSTLTVSELTKTEDDVREATALHSPLYETSAEGAASLLRAIQQVREQQTASSVKSRERHTVSSKQFNFAPYPAAKPSAAPPPEAVADRPGAYDYVQGTPIDYYAPSLFQEDADGPAVSLEKRHILFLTDQPEQWLALEQSGALDVFQYTVVCPASTQLKQSVTIDLHSDDTIAQTIQALNSIPYDTIIAVKDLRDYTEATLLLNDLEHERTLLDLLFATCRHAYEQLQKQTVSVVTLCLHAYRHQQLDPYTGLMSGFMKSLSREVPGATCKIIQTDEDHFYQALRQVEVELGQANYVGEVCYQDKKRYIFKLTPLQTLTKNREPYLNKDSVVLATGGGRGITAVLAEELLRRFGCTVIALGRTDLDSAPEAILTMDEETLQNYEAQFYKESLAQDKTKKITELKQIYLSYQAANELNQVIQRLQALPGTFEYMRVDINDEPTAARAVESIYRTYGRLDLLLHGAGVQVSGALSKKSLLDFRTIISTKLGSLGHLYRACETCRQGAPLHVHLLTSAFSYMGNDGQPDYGAANEAMNRLVTAMSPLQATAHWSSMAWLGWAGIGMTRGSAFAALAANRRLRGITKEEGQKIFADLIQGAPAAPCTVLLAAGERAYYDVAIESAPSEVVARRQGQAPAVKHTHTIQWKLSVDNAPYLRDHLVDGIPTLPGAFLTNAVAVTARELRPDLKIAAFERTRSYKFVRAYENKGSDFRVVAQVLSETEQETALHVCILSDFIHKNGMVLQKDVKHHETVVKMVPELITPPPEPSALTHLDGRLLPDPYIMEGSPVRLKGQFASMHDIRVGEHGRKAHYKLTESVYPEAKYQELIPNMMMVDAFWRFGAICETHDRRLWVAVPVQYEIMRVYFDYTDFDLPILLNEFTFSGVNPRESGDVLHVGPIESRDAEGKLMLVIEGGVCRKFGELPHAI